MATVETPQKPAVRSKAQAKAGATVQMSVRMVTDVADLEPHVSAWENLATNAIEPNVFHEPWMLLPALRQFGGDQQLLFLLVYATDPAHPDDPGTLCGFFPLERRRRYKGLPLAHVRLWRHMHCVLATPLIRAGQGHQTLEALFDWLAQDADGCRLLDLDFVTADGPFHHLLIDHLNQQSRLSFVDEVSTRALLQRGECGEGYLEKAVSLGSRKELRRQRRRLDEMGRLEVRELQLGDDLQQWLDQFLALEAAGWKGQNGTALGVHENERAFFRESARQAFIRRRLWMLGLFLDDKPIALKCNFLMGEGAIAFKIAFDENYARYSPGVQLELENILLIHARTGTRWMDSCAVSGHSMVNRIWKERRVMQNILISTGRRGGDLAVSVLPLLRWLQRRLRRKQQTGESS